jgi:hypothetical protein
LQLASRQLKANPGGVWGEYYRQVVAHLKSLEEQYE